MAVFVFPHIESSLFFIAWLVQVIGSAASLVLRIAIRQFLVFALYSPFVVMCFFVFEEFVPYLLSIEIFQLTLQHF